MANYKNIIPFLRKAEGGLSKAKTDSASSDPVPDGSGYHTNKGVTWTTMKRFAKTLGITDEKLLIKTFYAMPDSVWETIYKVGYWDTIGGDKINNQAIADYMVDWSYNAGPSVPVKAAQKLLKLKADGVAGQQTISALNALSPAQASAFLKYMDAERQAWYAARNQPANLPGWLARAKELYAKTSTYVLDVVSSPAGKAGFAVLGVLAVVTIFFLVSNSHKKTAPVLAGATQAMPRYKKPLTKKEKAKRKKK